jgi:hypothetical protein
MEMARCNVTTLGRLFRTYISISQASCKLLLRVKLATHVYASLVLLLQKTVDSREYNKFIFTNALRLAHSAVAIVEKACHIDLQDLSVNSCHCTGKVGDGNTVLP